MSQQKRTSILAELVKHTGKRVPAAFVYHTSDFFPDIERFHNLITGIYKPAWSEYALSIVMKLSSPYVHKDEIIYLDDGRWLMTYSPRTGGLAHSDNRALVKCMDTMVPLGVFKQLTDKTNRDYGSTYRVLGLGLITSYDANTDVFVVESANQAVLEQVVNTIPDEESRYEVRLYAQLTNEFRPFVTEARVDYMVNAPKRDKAFREIIRREYDFSCAVCEMKFRFDDLIETTAAHIVPKRKNGTDDPRNGLSLCHTHHWAFDVGIFSLNDGCEVILSPAVERAEKRNFGLLELGGKPILLPDNEGMHPHSVALDWHRKHVWQGVGN